MQRYDKEQLYKQETECYGCNKLTHNISGMCDACGGAAGVTQSRYPDRDMYSLDMACDMLEEREGGCEI